MATIYRKKYPVPLPAGAEIITRRGKRLARWTDKRGNVKTAPLARGGKRIMHVSDAWYARYIDADGIDRRVSTGCRDENAARKVLSDILADVEKITAGIITSTEADTAKHAGRYLRDHLRDHLDHLGRKRVRGRKVSARYRQNVKSRLKRLFKECRFRRLSDIGREAVEKWLDLAEDQGMGPATRNEYVSSLSAFCNWAIKTNRMSKNPVAGIGKADIQSDRRRVRRALTVDEMGRLLRAARLRPTAELGRKTKLLPEEDRCGRSSWTYVPLTAENLDYCCREGRKRLEGREKRRAELDGLGLERALFYLLAVLTGLRRKELASLTVGQVHLDAVPSPFLDLHGKDAKNGRGACIPLREDVVNELREHLGGSELSLDTSLFSHPPTIRIFDADLRAAGIPKKDERGHVVDIHALRHTFGTHLSATGAHPRTAMAAMRHSRIDLTMNYYTDPVLLDVAGAVSSLPDFSIQAEPTPPSARKFRTGS